MPEFDPAAAIIEDCKIREYLLSLEHRVGGAKARFFIGHGFHPEAPEDFANALRTHAAQNGVGHPIETGFGTKWVAEGPLRCPSGKNPRVRTVWILDLGGEFPRLVSAYPSDDDE